MDKYSIERELGHGGFGSVYLGRHLQSGDVVAVKVLKSTDVGAKIRFAREMNVMKYLNGTNAKLYVVPLLDDSLDVDGNPAFVMPLFGRGSLDKVLSQKALDPMKALDLIRYLATGLTTVHDHGIIHNDLKEQNILVDSDKIVISDWGAACVVGENLTEVLPAPQTRAYAPPDIFDPDVRELPSTDIYCLGKILSNITHAHASLKPKSGKSDAGLCPSYDRSTRLPPTTWIFRKCSSWAKRWRSSRHGTISSSFGYLNQNPLRV